MCWEGISFIICAVGTHVILSLKYVVPLRSHFPVLSLFCMLDKLKNICLKRHYNIIHCAISPFYKPPNEMYPTHQNIFTHIQMLFFIYIERSPYITYRLYNILDNNSKCNKAFEVFIFESPNNNNVLSIWHSLKNKYFFCLQMHICLSTCSWGLFQRKTIYYFCIMFLNHITLNAFQRTWQNQQCIKHRGFYFIFSLYGVT